jgi:hypothetical protein
VGCPTHLKGHAVQTAPTPLLPAGSIWPEEHLLGALPCPDSEVDSRSKNKRITHNQGNHRVRTMDPCYAHRPLDKRPADGVNRRPERAISVMNTRSSRAQA